MIYKNLILTNSNLTIVMNDGNIATKSPCSSSEYLAIKNSQTEEELLSYILSEEVKKEKEKEVFEKERINRQLEKIELLKETGDFEFRDNKVYLLGINRALPEFIVNKFIEILSTGDGLDSVNETEYEAFKRFTLWCIAAPRPQVLDKLFPFFDKYGLRLTKEGYFLAVRNVVTVEGTNNTLADFITKHWTRVRSNKKSPKNYFVFENEHGELQKKKEKWREEFSDIEIKGNLDELYNNLPTNEEVRYTDNYSHTFDIRIGKWVKTDPANIRWNSEDCTDSGGLHYSLDSTGLCGDKSILIAVNPMHVTGVGSYKATTWAYLPIMATEIEEAKELLLNQDFDSFELSFEQFEEGINGDLEETIKQGYVDAIHRDIFEIPTITSKDVQILVDNLESIKDIIKERVVDVEKTNMENIFDRFLNDEEENWDDLLKD